jgi:uncharacterized protein (TIGR00290 family)
MSKPRKIVLAWSSGKDSAWSLYRLRQMPDCAVIALLTTFNCSADRVAMHAVRRSLVQKQAEFAGLPLWPVELPWPCSNAIYEELMGEACRRAVSAGADAIAFGDLFLRDIRDYRERQLRGSGLEPLFPLWEIPTRPLAREMITGGLKAKVTCIDPAKLDRSFAGRDFAPAFLDDLPGHVDPCGENGEFHTFVYDGPVFERALDVLNGEVVERDGFVFADVKAGEAAISGQ